MARLAHLTAHLSEASGGVAGAIQGLTGAVAALGHDRVQILGVLDPAAPEAWRSWQVPGVEVQAFRPCGPRGFAWTPGLARGLEACRPDLVHAHGLWMYPSLACLRWHRRRGRPHLVTPHGMLDPWALRRARWRKRLVRAWFEGAHLASAACLHALNRAEAAAIRAFGWRGPICIVPNGVELPPTAAPAPTEGPRRLLFLGRLDPKKGIAELLRAWALVAPAARSAGWTLVIAGWGAPGYVARLQALARETGIAGDVAFAGPRFGAERDEAYRAATAFVLPSHSEGLPMTVLEAWSHGLPVLMTRACNLPQGLAAQAAIEIETDPAALAASLRVLLAMDPPALAALGRRGRALVEEEFTWRRVAQDMRAVYGWMLGGGAPPPALVED